MKHDLKLIQSLTEASALNDKYKCTYTLRLDTPKDILDLHNLLNKAGLSSSPLKEKKLGEAIFQIQVFAKRTNIKIREKKYELDNNAKNGKFVWEKEYRFLCSLES